MSRIEIIIPNWLDKILAWPILVWRKCRFGEPYRRIYLGEGIFTIISPPDYYKYNIFNWCLNRDGRNMYAVRVVNIDTPGKCGVKIISLHREIMNHPKGFVIDHKNRDGQDNRRSNLRPATKS